VAFLITGRFRLTQTTLWRIEVVPVPDLSNVASSTKAIITIATSIYRYGNSDDTEERGPERRRDRREHGEHKADKAHRCSGLVRPLGDRKKRNASSCSVSLTTRTGSSYGLCRSVSSCSLGGERGQGLCYVSTFYTTLVKKFQQANRASELRRTPLPRTSVNKDEKRKGRGC